MTRQKYVMGNWKMNGSSQTIHALLQHIHSIKVPDNQHVVVFPPAIYIEKTSWELRNSQLKWGAQNLSEFEEGAYTGEVSAKMLKDLKCEYVLIGHSERRQYYSESDLLAFKKIQRALSAGLKPVLCVGETLEEYKNHRTKQKVLAQIESVLKSPEILANLDKIIIAYEPIWAIGTGLTADPHDVQKIHQFIRETFMDTDEQKGMQLSIVYGGSVKGSNARQLFAMPDIDGVLVGGASLVGGEFKEICHAM